MSEFRPDPPRPEPRQASLEAITLRCRAGDSEAWKQLVEHFERPLYYYACRLLSDRDRALGALQDAWVRAFEGVDGLRDPRRVASWLYTLVRRAAQADLARRGRRLDSEPVEELDPADDVEGEGIEPWHDTEALHAALAELPPASAEILTLFFLQDLSQAGVAEVLGLPVGTVKSRLHHAKRALARGLEPGPDSNAPRERTRR